MIRTLIIPCGLSLLALAASAPAHAADGASSKERELEFPGDRWETGKPKQHGLTEQGLTDLDAVAAASDSTCLIVIHDGVLVHEWYAQGYGPDTVHANLFSVTKSVTSTLFGIARDEGLIDIDAPAVGAIPEWSGTASEDVTIRHLLSNDSGRHWSLMSDYGALLYGADQTAYGISVGQDEAPGTHWEYNNAAIQTLDRVFESATGQDIDAFAQEKLFAPIGMSATLARDAAGNALVYQGISTSCHDIARLGHLMLAGGRWRNQQIVSGSWVEEATTPSTALNDAYGYLWWLNREGRVVEPTFPERIEYDGRLVPGASEDTFVALGAFGQLVIVDPTEGYVVVRLQDVLDLEAAIATDPDPLGTGKLRTVLTAFQGAKR